MAKKQHFLKNFSGFQAFQGILGQECAWRRASGAGGDSPRPPDLPTCNPLFQACVSRPAFEHGQPQIQEQNNRYVHICTGQGFSTSKKGTSKTTMFSKRTTSSRPLFTNFVHKSMLLSTCHLLYKSNVITYLYMVLRSYKYDPKHRRLPKPTIFEKPTRLLPATARYYTNTTTIFTQTILTYARQTKDARITTTAQVFFYLCL